MELKSYNTLKSIFTLFVISFISLNNVTAGAGSESDSLREVLANTEDEKQKTEAYRLMAEQFGTEQLDSVRYFASRSLNIAQKNGFVEDEARMYTYLGGLQYNMSDYDSATYYFHKALSLINNSNNSELIAKVYNDIAVTYQQMNVVDSALFYFKKSLKIKENIEDYEAIAKTLSNLGILYFRQADYAKALEYYYEALEMKDKYSVGPLSISKTLVNIGNVYIRTERYEDAINYYRRAIDLKSKVGDKRGMSTVANNIASVYWMQEKTDSALYFMEKSLALKKEIGDKRGTAGVLSNLASVYRQTGSLNKSLDYHNEALSIREEIGDIRGVASSLCNMGSLYLTMGDVSRSQESLVQAVEIGEKNGFDRVLEEAYLNFSGLFAQQGDYRQSLDYYKKHHQIREDLLNESSMKRMENLKEEYERKQQQELIKRQKAEQELVQAELNSTRRQNLLLLVSIVFVLLIGILLYRQNRIKSKYNDQLKDFNAELDRRVKVRTQELQQENDERRNVEKELRASEEKYRTVTETVNAGIAIADGNEKIIFMNKAFSKMLGYEPSELMDQSLEMIVNSTTYEKLKQGTQERTEGKSDQYMVKLHRKDGEELDAILTASPLFDEQGRFIGGVATVTDVTEFKKSENTISRAYDKLQRVNSAKSQFLIDTEREVGVLIKAIAEDSETLREQLKEKADKPQKELVQAIHQHAAMIKSKIQSFEEIAGIQMEDIHIGQDIFRLNDMLNSILQKMDRENNTVDFRMSSRDVKVIADKHLMNKVLGSLIENVFRHSTDKKVIINASVGEQNNVMAQVDFQYTGKIFGEEGLETTHSRLDDTDTKSHSGHQKGPVWIRKMLYMQNGKIETNKINGEVCNVRISIPICSKSNEEDCKNKLTDLLLENNNPVFIFSNSPKLKELSVFLQQKKSQIQYIQDLEEFFNTNKEGGEVLDNSIILIDSELEDPWSIQKTLLELKQRNYQKDNLHYIAVWQSESQTKEQLIDSGFDAFVTIENCIRELNQYLSSLQKSSL
ncbi:MAG: tetratricopeptide repeat protein [Bacteroidales bacterium]